MRSVSRATSAALLTVAAATPAQLLGDTRRVRQARARGQLFYTFTHAVVGTVTSVETDDTVAPELPDRSEPLLVQLEVLAAFNRASVPSRLTVSMGDRGPIFGHPFAVGGTYFVSLSAGERVGGCGATRLVPTAAVDRDVALLQAAARRGGVPISRIDPAAPPAGREGEPGAADPSARDAPPWGVPAAAIAVALAVSALAAGVALVRRRRTS